MTASIIQNSAVPKYQQLAEIMLAKIRGKQYPANRRFLSEHEWAERLKVSRQTVRLAIQQLEQNGYLRREQGRGTFVTLPTPSARKTHGTRVRDIGILVSCITKYASIIRAVEDVCKEGGYHLIVGNSDLNPEKEKHYINEWISKPLLGLILFPSYNSRLPDYLPLQDRHIPFVLIDAAIEGLKADLVGVDNVKGAMEGTRRLIRHGCRRIAFLSGYTSASTSRARLDGYRSALEEASLPYDRAIILEGGFNPEFGAAAVHQLLTNHNDIDGLFIANHTITEGAVPALLAQGRRIPQDLKVCTFDEPALPFEARVPLIMVKQPFAAEGRAAAELLLRRIAEPWSDQNPTPAMVLNKAVQITDLLT